MKKALLQGIVIMMLLVYLPAQKGKGSGANDTFPAVFEFADCSGAPCITGDGIYEGGVDYVKAEVLGSGNPILELRNVKSSRVLPIFWGDCAPSGEGIVPDMPQVFLAHSQLATSFGDLIENRFLGMGLGDVAYSRLLINFAPEEKHAEGWSIRYSENQEFNGTAGGRVQVTRSSQTHWQVTAVRDDGTPAVAIITRVQNGAFRPVGACVFQLDISIDCPTCPAP